MLDFDSSQPSEDSGLVIDSPRASGTPGCGIRKSSMVIASPTCYRQRETRFCFHWSYCPLWLYGIVAAIVLVGI